MDWNPAGLAIAMTYKYGGVHGDRRRTGQEYTQEMLQYALGSDFKLLGLRECHLDKLQADSTTPIALQPFTVRDDTMLSTFVDGAWLVALPENYTILSEAKAMRKRNGKAELEVVPDLATFVASEVEYGEYDDKAGGECQATGRDDSTAPPHQSAAEACKDPCRKRDSQGKVVRLSKKPRLVWTPFMKSFMNHGEYDDY